MSNARRVGGVTVHAFAAETDHRALVEAERDEQVGAGSVRRLRSRCSFEFMTWMPEVGRAEVQGDRIVV